MRKWLAVVIFWVVLLLVAGNVLAQLIENPGNGSFYSIVEADGSAVNYWLDAELKAIGAGGHLVTINDAAEQAWIYDTLVNGSNRNYWIGLNDMVTEDTLAWSNNEAPSYRNWRPGWDNAPSKDYAYIRQSDGLWDIGTKNAYRLGIAEIPTTVPEPASTLFFAIGGIALALKRRLR
jgi:hypothetical protein